MGIYIPDMEMPKNCGECFACKAELSHEKKIIYVCCFTRKEYGFDGNRRDNCPLIPVPPHGRLIDADGTYKDAITQVAFAFVSHNKEQAAMAVANVISNAPTIIPAEGGE